MAAGSVFARVGPTIISAAKWVSAALALAMVALLFLLFVIDDPFELAAVSAIIVGTMIVLGLTAKLAPEQLSDKVGLPSRTTPSRLQTVGFYILSWVTLGALFSALLVIGGVFIDWLLEARGKTTEFGFGGYLVHF
jgi:hypothetical protein